MKAFATVLFVCCAVVAADIRPRRQGPGFPGPISNGISNGFTNFPSQYGRGLDSYSDLLTLTTSLAFLLLLNRGALGGTNTLQPFLANPYDGISGGYPRYFGGNTYPGGIGGFPSSGFIAGNNGGYLGRSGEQFLDANEGFNNVPFGEGLGNGFPPQGNGAAFPPGNNGQQFARNGEYENAGPYPNGGNGFQIGGGPPGNFPPGNNGQQFARNGEYENAGPYPNGGNGFQNGGGPPGNFPPGNNGQQFARNGEYADTGPYPNGGNGFQNGGGPPGNFPPGNNGQQFARSSEYEDAGPYPSGGNGFQNSEGPPRNNRGLNRRNRNSYPVENERVANFNSVPRAYRSNGNNGYIQRNNRALNSDVRTVDGPLIEDERFSPAIIYSDDQNVPRDNLVTYTGTTNNRNSRGFRRALNNNEGVVENADRLRTRNGDVIIVGNSGNRGDLDAEIGLGNSGLINRGRFNRAYRRPNRAS